MQLENLEKSKRLKGKPAEHNILIERVLNNPAFQQEIQRLQREKMRELGQDEEKEIRAAAVARLNNVIRKERLIKMSNELPPGQLMDFLVEEEISHLVSVQDRVDSLDVLARCMEAAEISRLRFHELHNEALKFASSR